LTFLGFSYNFLQISKVSLKKKREKLKQCWAEFNPGGPSPGKIAHARARAAVFAERPSAFWITRSGCFHYYFESLPVCKKNLHVLFLYTLRSPTTTSAAELRRARRPAEWGKDWRSRVADTELNLARTFSPT
jgi:hypothetical protein